MEAASPVLWRIECIWTAHSGQGALHAMALLLNGAPSFGEVLPQSVLTHKEGREWKRLCERALPKRRRHWLLGRLAAKLAAREWLMASMSPLELTDIEVGNDPQGKPYLKLADVEKAPAVSLAHSGAWALAVVAARTERIGADIEAAARELRDPCAFSRLAFSPEEQALLPGCHDASWQKAALALWCAKEAAAKATGLGLRGQPRAFELIGCMARSAQIRYGTGLYAVSLFVEPSFTVAFATPDNGDALVWGLRNSDHPRRLMAA